MRLPAGIGVRTDASRDAICDAAVRAREGDPEAFRVIFDRFGKPIIGFIYDMVNDRDLAEELAQETFVRAYRSLRSLRDETKLSTWLFGIAKNVAYEGLRARRKRSAVAIETVFDLEAPQKRPEGVLLNKELNSVIAEALEELDDDKRLVFALKLLQQKSYEEISEITGYSIPKLKTDLHRARAEMRKRLQPYMESA